MLFSWLRDAIYAILIWLGQWLTFSIAQVWVVVRRHLHYLGEWMYFQLVWVWDSIKGALQEVGQAILNWGGIQPADLQAWLDTAGAYWELTEYFVPVTFLLVWFAIILSTLGTIRLTRWVLSFVPTWSH